MAQRAAKMEKKQAYFDKLIGYLQDIGQALIVDADHVGSKQMQEVRLKLRGRAIVLFGKNTMIRTALRRKIESEDYDPALGLDKLLSIIKGNLGFIFCIDSMDSIREVISNTRVTSAAKAGVISQCDVKIPAGPSGLDPSQTNFFQALNIGTKIVKGQIEITTEFKLVTEGEKVSMGAQVLLSKLGIKPFEYGLELAYVYDKGSTFEKSVLDITDDVMISKFVQGASNVAALGREVGIPTAAGLPHMMSNAFKNVASLVAEIDFDFEQVKDIKNFLANPEAFAAAMASSGGGGGGGGGAKEEKKAAAKVVEEEEEEDMDFDLFG